MEESESETNMARVMVAKGEITKVYDILNTILIGPPLAEDKEYFSRSIFCQAK